MEKNKAERELSKAERKVCKAVGELVKEKNAVFLYGIDEVDIPSMEKSDTRLARLVTAYISSVLTSRKMCELEMYRDLQGPAYEFYLSLSATDWRTWRIPE